MHPNLYWVDFSIIKHNNLYTRKYKMKNHVYWLLELEVQAGKEQEFRTLMREMVAATLVNESGALSYEWNTSEDGRVCHILFC